MVCDSNILIDYLNGDEKIVTLLQKWHRESQLLIISPITTVEVLALPTLGPEDISIARNFLANFASIPFDDAIAEHAAAVSRIYNLKVPDSVIVATAISRNVPLVTRDKQIRKVKELDVIVP